MSTTNLTPTRTPTFFKHCNESATYLRTELRLIKAFEVLGVSSQTARRMIESARVIWTTRNGTTPVNFGKRDPSVIRRKERAATELCNQYPGVFQMALTEEEEEKFVRVRAPHAMIFLANMYLQRKRHARNKNENKNNASARASSEDVAEDGSTEDAGMDDAYDAEMSKVVEAYNEVNAQPITVVAKGSPPSTPTPTAPETTKAALFTEPPFFVEVRTAKTGLRVMTLEWKAVLGESGVPSYETLQNKVKAFPLVKWPKNVLFTHVGSNESTFIFAQGALDTAFRDWRRCAPANDIFILYVNNYAGLPPAQLLVHPGTQA